MNQPTPTTSTGKMPRQIPYIIANEGCERFSFYGMRNILTPFLISTLLLFLPESERTGEAKHVFHTFVIGVYFFPLLGGWPTASSASTTPCSGSASCTARATPASPSSRTTSRASTSAWA
jgi:hypothetical protein